MEDSDVFDDGLDNLLEQVCNESLCDSRTEDGKPLGDDSLSEDRCSGPSQEHLNTLRRQFGHHEFKPLQWNVIRTVLEERRDQCVVMATGYGKSLCYQYVPVYLNKTALVVSPLISLMEDQVLAMNVANISACFLGSAQLNKQKTYSDIQKGKYRVVYVTPEFADSALDTLKSILSEDTLALIAIDEAHCVSHWGHDFRAAYRNLRSLRRAYPNVPLIALTATATEDVIKDICLALDLKNPKVSKTSFDRPNLFLEISQKTAPWNDLSKLMETVDGSLGQRKNFNGATIIYCPTKSQVDQVSKVLNEHGVKALPYHAGLSMSVRNANQKAFVRDQCDAIVATVAFGMGINKPDVRQVVHYGAPKNMESYYQEIGRAGRDGHEALCKVFYTSGDFQTHRFLANEIKNDKWREHNLSMIHKMEVFLGLRKNCRRREILAHFGEDLQQNLGRKKCCDNCSESIISSSDIDEKVDFTEDTLLLLMAVKGCRGKYGLGTPVAVVRGTGLDKKRDFLSKISCFGKGKSKNKEFWMALGRSLINEGYISQRTMNSNSFGGSSFKRSFQVVDISEKGRSLLNNENETVMLVPTINMRAKKKIETVKATIAARPAWASSASVVLDEDEESLLVALRNLRKQMADREQLAPYMIVSEEFLEQLSRIRPSTRESLEKMGLVQAKIDKFGTELLEAIAGAVNRRDSLNFDNFATMTEVMDERVELLSETQRTSYQLFVEYGNLAKVALERGLKTSTIVTHLSEAIKIGLHVDLTKLNLSERNMSVIKKAIASPSIASNVLRMAPIKEEAEKILGGEITWDEVKIVISMLIAKHGVIDNILQWTEKEKDDALNHSTTKGIEKQNNDDVYETCKDFSSNDKIPSSTSNDEILSKFVKSPDQSQKRKIPDWMQNRNVCKEVMKKKMKQNSLFK